MIGKGTGKALGIMAITAIRSGYRMGRNRARLAGRVNTVVIVMAGFAGLHSRVKDPVVENATEAEINDTMADRTIHIGYRMAVGLSLGKDAIVAGLAGDTEADDIRAGMIRIGSLKTEGRMAKSTFCGGLQMAVVFPDRHFAIMATRAGP